MYQNIGNKMAKGKKKLSKQLDFTKIVKFAYAQRTKKFMRCADNTLSCKCAVLITCNFQWKRVSDTYASLFVCMWKCIFLYKYFQIKRIEGRWRLLFVKRGLSGPMKAVPRSRKRKYSLLRLKKIFFLCSVMYTGIYTFSQKRK